MYDWYSPINKHFIYPLNFWRNRDPRMARLQVLERNQYLPPEQLRDIQFAALQKLLRHAVDTVPYYRDLFAAQNLRPDDIRSVADLVRVPVLTKALMQQNLKRMKSTNYSADQLMEDASGGSTGQPTVFFKDWNRQRMRAADQIRHDRWSGWDLGDPFALIWGASRDLTGFLGAEGHFAARNGHTEARQH